MNKAAIQRFAIQARKDLIEQVSQRAYQYGITKDGYGEADAVTVGGRALSTDEQRQRKELVAEIQRKGYTQVMEEVAYTWFNRFIALRFMEVNNYLPSHIRVFSDSTGAFKPEILNDVLHLDLPGLDADKVAELIESNQTEALYRYLLLTQCNALNESLPRMFEKMGGYTELLLPNNILKQDSVLSHMVTDIPDEDWTDQVQIIGWLYQYYNSELKDDTFALLKKNVKITKERIPSATQLFTPDWIVRYMVENSLGRLWIEGHPDDELKAEWKYYLDEAEQEADVKAQLDKIREEYCTIKPQDIKVIDSCMGSGHILVYAFDVLIQIYKKYGVSERDAAQSILQNNLYGLDIDDRAAQLAYFAVMMKARQYDRRIFTRGIQPNVYSIVESNGIDNNTIDYFVGNDPKLKKDFGTLVDELHDAKEYGSILNISQVDFAALYARVEEVRGDISLFREIILNTVVPVLQVAEVLSQKYDCVITNPPYMGSKQGMNATLKKYLQKAYEDSKSDLYCVFMEVAQNMAKPNRYISMINQHGWMFLSSFAKYRTKLIHSQTILNMLHLGTRAFEEIGGEVVQSTAFVLRNNYLDYNGNYIRLTDYSDAAIKEAKTLEIASGANKSDLYTFQMRYFSYLPDALIGYWISKKIIDIFNNEKCLADIAKPRQGLSTSDNDRFLRLWFEPDIINIGFGFASRELAKASGLKWFPYNKGGEFRKWYGNNNYVINWQYDGTELRAWADYLNTHFTSMGRLVSQEFYFKKGLTWSGVGATRFGVRCYSEGMLFDVGANGLFVDDILYYYLAGFLNTKIADEMIKVLNPTINTGSGTIGKLPIIIDDSIRDEVTTLVKDNISLVKQSWDSYETSWDFSKHPLVPTKDDWIKQCHFQSAKPRLAMFAKVQWHYEQWESRCLSLFESLRENEERINKLFIGVYGLEKELSSSVDEEDVSIKKAELSEDVRSLISYAVGCMFGRYSLDVPGLAYAGGEWDASKYTTIIPDKDNIIPICDDDYFKDDITGRFVKWVEAVYGKETLEENLKFIADALGGRGTPREVIRNYFLNDFYADHCNTYSVTGSGKRPIYWLFDSGKKNGFKALIYMHRYQSDLLARMRTDYVHEQQERYRTQLSHLADEIDHVSASERVKLTKLQKKIQEQALEIQKY